MKKQTVSRFIGEYVKIEKTDGFLLYGTIDEVDDTSLLFTTNQRTALLSFDVINAIVPMDRRND